MITAYIYIYIYIMCYMWFQFTVFQRLRRAGRAATTAGSDSERDSISIRDGITGAERVGKTCHIATKKHGAHSFIAMESVQAAQELLDLYSQHTDLAYIGTYIYIYIYVIITISYV